MGESTVIKCLFKFCEYVVEIFGDRYLRRTNADDVQRLLQMHDESHSFLGMLDSLDCMHWKWKNCPVAWKGQFTKRHGSPTIVLEAIASHDLWIWHAFFGVAGSRNDINMLYESPIFNNVLQGNAPEIHFTVNNTVYTKGYYLTDGIYREWATFVKAFPCPEDPKRKLFKERLESARKYVEWAFGVLQSRWAIVRGPARYWYRKKLNKSFLNCQKERYLDALWKSKNVCLKGLPEKPEEEEGKNSGMLCLLHEPRFVACVFLHGKQVSTIRALGKILSSVLFGKAVCHVGYTCDNLR
ncbi:uncharacterized protein [Primulina huaijiensis]|uniref:uncharacterized protein n=1 Tax=Primulina huaijiensis TaxID=1492673 RepID=UPI003CC75664